MLKLIRSFSTSTAMKGGMELVKEFSQKKLIEGFNTRSAQPVPSSGSCLASSIKYGLLRLKQQEFKYNDINVEKMSAKQLVYKSARGMLSEAAGSEVDPTASNQEAAYALAAERSRKFTDSKKQIHVNSVSVGKPSELPLDEYLLQHPLKEGQLLIHGFSDPRMGGHAVCIVMAVGGKTYYFDSRKADYEFTPRDGTSKDDQVKQLASEIGMELRSEYNFYDLSKHYIIPINNLQHELSSHLITKDERSIVDKKLNNNEWDVETEIPTTAATLKTLYVAREQGGELESAIFQIPGENKILKLSNVQIPQAAWSQIKVNTEATFTPVPIQADVAEMPTVRLNLSGAVDLLRARTFTPEENEKVTNKFRATGNQRPKMANAIPQDEIAVEVLHVHRGQNGELQSAIFRKGGKSLEVFKLRFDEIPEHMRSGLKESDEEILLKAKPLSPLKQMKSTKRR